MPRSGSSSKIAGKNRDELRVEEDKAADAARRAESSRLMRELAERMADVRPGGPTVLEVAKWATKQGLKSFSRRPHPYEADLLASAWWSLPLAAAWVAYREPAAALKYWIRYKHWGRAMWSADEACSQATANLLQMLKAEKLEARGIRPEGCELEPIGSAEWHTLTWERFGQVDLISRHFDHRPAFVDVVVNAGRMRQIWPERTGADRARESTVAAERACQKLLEQLMRDPANDPIPKRTLLERCVFEHILVTERAFDRAFIAAVKATGSGWDRPGRRKSPRS